MRATWFGARSGLSSTVTGPRLVSMMSVSSGVAAMSDLLLLGLEHVGRGRLRRIVGVGGNLILTILSGFDGGSPGLILSTASMPSITWPQIVYLPLRKGAASQSR